MDTQQQSQQTVNDDQELAKVLAGINRETSPTEQSNLMSSLAEESAQQATAPTPTQEDTGAPEPLPDDIALPEPPVVDTPSEEKTQDTAEPTPEPVQPMIQHRQMAQPPSGMSGGANTDQEPASVPSIEDSAPQYTPEPTPEPQPDPTPTPQIDNTMSVQHDAPQSTSELDSIKTKAMGELRPLVDKLSVSPEEKFDTLLLLIRSTDDKNLIEPAYKAAAAISDDARRAQALLDVIKEIDFLNQPQK